MKKKLLCIITLSSYNYGNRLQHFALNRLLKSYGIKTMSWTDLYFMNDYICFETSKIKRLYKRILPMRLYWFLFRIKDRIQSSNAQGIDDRRIERFREFTKMMIDNCRPVYIRNYEQLARRVKNSHIDFFVTGSDQVWNPSWDRDGFYFLRFADKTKRLSFAASFGVSRIPIADRKRITDYLNDMKYISVREKRAVEIVKELTGRDAVLTLDPTLLLSRKSWDEYVDSVRVDLPDRYIATYFLGELPPAVKEFATRKGLQIVALNDLNQPDMYAIDPLQFVYVIRNADYVLTDSFHGTAFSIKYEREFYVFRRKGCSINMFSRIETLTDMFELSTRIQEDDRIIEDMPISAEKWNEIEHRLEDERERAMTSFEESMR